LYPVVTIFVAVLAFGEHIDLARGIGVAAAIAAGLLLSLEKEESGSAAARRVVN